MAEVYFYHLEQMPLKAVLPRLLQTGLQRGWRMVVESGRPESLGEISEAIWAHEDVAFITHGMGDDRAEGQPIWLCAGPENPISADYRFFIEGALPASVEGLARAIIMFDGGDASAVDAARAAWKQHKGDGHEVSYWKQNAEGRWENLAG
jgi:DNA polymerase-3 subunit chi